MNRLAAILLLVAGIILLALSLKVPSIRPLLSIGGFAIFLGLVSVGLSFVQRPDSTTDPEPMSFSERMLGIFLEPTRTFQNLRRHPRWLAAMLLMGLTSGAYSVAFIQRMTPERIADTMSGKQIEAAESFGATLPPEAKADMKAQTLQGFKTPAGQAAIFLTSFSNNLLGVIVLGALFMLLGLAFGGKINYWQGVSIAAHASLPGRLLENILSAIVMYLKPAEDLDPLKGLQRGLVSADLSLLTKAAEHPVLYTILSFAGVFTIYWLWLMATGLRHGSEKMSSGGAWGITLAIFFALFMLAVGMSAAFPGFVG